MYGKIENGRIKFPPKHLKENGRYVANYDHHDEALRADGWLELVTSEPEQREGFYPVEKYTEENGKIIQSWEYVESPEDDL